LIYVNASFTLFDRSAARCASAQRGKVARHQVALSGREVYSMDGHYQLIAAIAAIK
jgi:hypothetical protein